MADITMPQLGETVTEGTIIRWAKSVGDRVEEDEVLFEVSTDKVDSEVPSPASGYLTEILVQEGETADVGARLAVIGDEPGAGGADNGAEGASGAGSTGGAGTTAGSAPVAQDGDPGQAAMEAAKAEQAGATEEAADQAARGTPAPDQEKSPPAGEASRGPAGGDGASRPGGGTKLLSPVVRRLVTEHGLDPNEIRGTGTGGRITRNDVLAAVEAQGSATTRSPAAPAAPVVDGRGQASSAGAGGAPPPAPRPRGDQVVAFSNIRRRTAEHMRRSLETSAHTLVVVEVDYDAVDRARLPARESFKAEEGVSLSYLPFVARAVVDAIHQFPHVNASVGDNQLVVHGGINLGIAVDLSFEGLIVPVVHGADGKRLRVLAREIAGLAARARAKKLGADDISGGTITITNPGGFGTFLTAPIINQPQVAILSTDGVRPKPVAVALPGGGYGVAVHPVGNLALGFDHRAFDGAYASAFLTRVRDILETRDWTAELA